MMSYSIRITITSAALAALTSLAIALAPQPEVIRVVAQSPNGRGIAPDSPISVTFSRAVDQRSAERAFVLYPPAKGRFSWRAQTLVFTPSAPLQPGTTYRVTIRPGLRDLAGYENRYETSWPFYTR